MSPRNPRAQGFSEAAWLAQGLLIPYALDMRTAPPRRLRPGEAAKGRGYVCAECGQALRLHGGARQRLHFRHEAYLRPCGFREDGADRVIARHAVLDAAGRPEGVRLICPCPVCRAPVEQPWPAPVAEARLKHPVATRAGGRVADVALLDAAARLVAVIEIHRDREPPAWRFRDVTPVPWVVASARPLIADPHQVRAEQVGGLAVPPCAACTAAAQAQAARERRSAAGEADTPAPSLLVDLDTGEVVKRLHAPLDVVLGHCAFLNQRAGRRRYAVLRHGEIVA